MDLQSLFMEKWPYKIAAIVLSVLVWLNVTANRETQGHQISTRLIVEVQDSAWAVSEVQDEVTTIFEGRSGDIVAMNLPVLRASIESPDDSVVQLDLSVEDVEYDRSLNVIATSVTPPRVFVHLQPRVTRRVPVLAMSDATAEDGFAIDRTVILPDSVTLSGPAAAVESVVAVATERLEFGEVTQSVTRSAGLELPEGPASLEIEPSQVSVTVEVDSVIVRHFQLTVQVVGQASAEVRAQPDVVVVDVEGAAGAVSQLAATDLEVIVRLDQAPAGPQRMQVQVRLPASVDLRATALPDTVTIIPVAAGGLR